MDYMIRLLPSDAEFQASTNKSILESALESNIHLAYSCRRGDCGACKVKVVDGQVMHTESGTGLSTKDIDEGYVLSCLAVPQSSLVLEAEMYPELDGIEQTVLPCKLESIKFPVSDIAILKLRFPPNRKFNYLPGQYIELISGEVRRSYSVANAQSSDNCIELHIRKVNGGTFSELVFNKFRLNQLLRMEGPLGTFFIRKSDAPVIFVAGGTGFAPVKAMVEQLLFEGSGRQIYIYWGVQNSKGFYSDIPNQWQTEYATVRYVPVVSNDDLDWNGRRGYVHKAVIQDFNDLSGHEVYACGSTAMINAAKSDFIAGGLKAEKYFSDAFVVTK